MPVSKRVVLAIIVIAAGVLLIQAMRLLMLKHDIGAFKKYWDKQNAQTASPDSILYVVLGDSTAQGIGASKPANGYAGLLAAQISKKSNRPVHVINLSVSRAKIQSVIQDQLPRLQRMQLPAESVVTLGIGANDLGSFDADKFSSQMEELFRQLPPQAVVADMPYFGGGRARNRETNAVKALAIIHKIASKYGLRVAALHETTKSNDNLGVYGADFFHPNDKGYRNWYQAFAEALSI